MESFLEKQNHNDGKVSSWKRLEQGERVDCTRPQGDLEGTGNVYLLSGGGCQSVSVCQNSSSCTLKTGECYCM